MNRTPEEVTPVSTILAQLESSQGRLAAAREAATRGGRGVVASGAVWLLVAGALLMLSSGAVWSNIPLISSTTGWTVSVDLGWGITSHLLSYGTLTVALALVCLFRALAAWPGPLRVRTFAGPRLRRPLPLRPRTLVGLGYVAIGISLLYGYQFIFVDFAHVASQAKQESESLIIRHHLGYSLPAQTIHMSAFTDVTATTGDRMLLLVQLMSPGVLLPVLAGLVCCYGAYYLTHREACGTSDHASAPDAEAPRRRTRATLAVIALCVLGCILLGRAPAALVLEQRGQQALQAGDYQTALTTFDRAQALNPALFQLASFRQLRGEAEFALHNTQNFDAQLYLADQYRHASALDQAWSIDVQLNRAYPHDPAVVRDTALTAEMQLEHSLASTTLPTDPETALDDPPPARPSLGAALLWSTRLLATQSNNLMGHYVRGRVFFALHDYEAATTDFSTIVTVAQDHDLQSAAYTYLALCAGALGNPIDERAFLRKAIALDHGYNNTTAREAASGFH